jgi:hypothetical protein
MAGMLSQNLTLNVKCYVRSGERPLRRGRGTLSAVADLELTRDSDDRHRYALEGVGALRLEGFARQRATIEAAGRTWQAAPSGFWRRNVVATDAAGQTVAEFEPRRVRSGGTLRVGARELEIAPASRWKQRYALRDGDRELALLEAKGWGKRPVRVTVDDPAAVDPHVLLLAAFLARRLAEDASAAAAGT